jgi:hypothetical protein
MAGQAQKRSPPHILADEHFNPPAADDWALVRRRRIEIASIYHLNISEVNAQQRLKGFLRKTNARLEWALIILACRSSQYFVKIIF